MEGSRLVNENQNIPVSGIMKNIGPDKSKSGRGDVYVACVHCAPSRHSTLNIHFMFLYSALLLKHELSSIYRKTSGIAYLHDIESDNDVNNANIPMASGCQSFTSFTIFWFSHAPPRL